jgi:hypothetical protein
MDLQIDRENRDVQTERDREIGKQGETYRDRERETQRHIRTDTRRDR